MRRLWLVCAAMAVVGCSRKDNGAGSDTTAMSNTAAPADLSLADVAGKWNVQVARMDNDSALLTYELNATADTSGWTITFPTREPIPVRILSVAGDSLVTEIGPYASALRPGVQTTTQSVFRLRGDRLMGVSTVHYQTTEPDSVVQLRSRGRKAP